MENQKEEPKQELHICKHCGVETTQPDDECYAKPKQEALEEAAKKYANKWYNSSDELSDFLIGVASNSFKHGAKWEQERSYSKEEVIAIVNKIRETGLTVEYLLLTEKFKKK